MAAEAEAEEGEDAAAWTAHDGWGAGWAAHNSSGSSGNGAGWG